MRNLYEEIIGSGFKLSQPDTDKVWVDYTTKRLCIGKQASENTIYMELALARMLNTSLARYRLSNPNTIKTALAEASTLAWLREFHNKNIRVPFRSPALRDTVAYCLRNGFNEAEMLEAGIPESLTSILAKVQDSIAPTESAIAPTGRMNDAEVVVEYLIKQYEDADKEPQPEAPPKESISNREKQDSSNEGSGEGGGSKSDGTDEEDSEESDEEDSEDDEDSEDESVDDLLEEGSSKEDREAEAEKRYKFFREETERLAREAAEETAKKSPKQDSEELTDAVKGLVKPPDSPASPSDKPAKVVTVQSFSEASSEDFENTPISPEERAFKTYSPRYLNLEIISLPLNSTIVNKGLAKKRSVEQGSVPGRFTDPASQRYFQDRGKHFAFTGGASILIDGSGSMTISNDHIKTLATTYPTGVVGVYGGPSNAKGIDFGTLVIIARGGRMAHNFKRSDYFGTWNSVDGPVIDWLCKQRSPRIFVCDLGLTGIGDRRIDPALQRATVEKILRNKIICISDGNAISQFMNTGKVNSDVWTYNNDLVRAHFFANGARGVEGYSEDDKALVNRDPIFERSFINQRTAPVGR